MFLHLHEIILRIDSGPTNRMYIVFLTARMYIYFYYAIYSILLISYLYELWYLWFSVSFGCVFTGVVAGLGKRMVSLGRYLTVRIRIWIIEI